MTDTNASHFLLFLQAIPADDLSFPLQLGERIFIQVVRYGFLNNLSLLAEHI